MYYNVNVIKRREKSIHKHHKKERKNDCLANVDVTTIKQTYWDGRKTQPNTIHVAHNRKEKITTEKSATQFLVCRLRFPHVRDELKSLAISFKFRFLAQLVDVRASLAPINSGKFPLRFEKPHEMSMLKTDLTTLRWMRSRFFFINNKSFFCSFVVVVKLRFYGMKMATAIEMRFMCLSSAQTVGFPWFSIVPRFGECNGKKLACVLRSILTHFSCIFSPTFWIISNTYVLLGRFSTWPAITI